MRRRTIVKITFISCCLTLFLYKTYEVFESYWKHEIVTKIYLDRQENLRMPLVCISTRNRRFFVSNNSTDHLFLDGQNLTYDQYENGRWKLENVSLTEKELYEQITPELHDLIDYMYIQKTNGTTASCSTFVPGDAYEEIMYNSSVLQNVSQLSMAGLNVTRSDYYPYLKCYCLAINKENFPYGVQGFYIYPKIEIAVLIVPPGRFYDYNRKLSSFELELNHTHQYVIQYGIYKLLNAHNPCNEDLSYNEDECKLKKLTESLINQYNCTPPWLLYHNNQSEICGPHVSQDAAKKYKQHRYEAYDECENPCEKMFITTLFNSKSPGEQELQIRFARNIQITEDYIKVSLLEALANIGGYLGMILGISILDVEKVAIFLLRFCFKESTGRQFQEYIVEGPDSPAVSQDNHLQGRDNLAVNTVTPDKDPTTEDKSISTNHEQAANTTKPNSLETEPNEPTRISTAKLYKTL